IIYLQDWGVNYSPSYVCALKGSTVKMSCALKYPRDHKIKTVFWTKPAVTDGDLPPLCLVPENRGRVQCVRENEDNHNITLTDVTEADKHIYYCRFITNIDTGKWTGVPGAQLDVTGRVHLQVETQQSVKERDSVTLRCKSSCSLPEQTTFIWYRNTQRLTTGTVNVNQLQLQSVSRADEGNYRCAVSGYEHLISPPVYLKVEYPPRNVSVSINGSGEIVEGDSVTLSCSSDSNPPALNFSWFKENQSSAVGSGQSFSISSFNSSHSGRYYCEAQNKHGSQRSESVSVSCEQIFMNILFQRFRELLCKQAEDVIYNLVLSPSQVMFQIPLFLNSPIYSSLGLFYCLDINGFQFKFCSFVTILIISSTLTAFPLHSHTNATHSCNSQSPFSSHFVQSM
uniref:Ig-like domain-containing protein n=1 Tax=Sinocyclocheilus grahami TaxID=75366 RepID=A0A672QYV8_SINGR